MKCPGCKDVNLAMADLQGFEIDHCPECRGVWPDRGELDKLIERPAAQPSPPREREAYHDRSRSHDNRDYRRNKKRESLLGKLLDF